MNERKMSPKMFLHRSNGKIAPDTFLAKHREFLSEGTLGILTGAIFSSLDTKTILPSAALSQIQTMVQGHVLSLEIQKREEQLLKVKEPAVQKAYVATILDSKGEIATRMNDEGEEESLRKGFDLPQRASEWADRRLFDGSPDWHGEVFSTYVGDTMMIDRKDSVARILRQPKGPAIHVTKTAKTLSFQQKVSNSRAIFSHGLERLRVRCAPSYPLCRNKTPINLQKEYSP